MNLTCEPASPAIAPCEPCDMIDHPSGYLALSPRNQRFTLRGRPGFIAYRVQGMHLIAFGGVHAPVAERAMLLDAFLAFARRRMRRVLAVQVRDEQTELFRGRGFAVNRLGASYGVRLGGFSYSGTRRMKVRQKIKQARAAGLRVFEVGCAQWPANDATFVQLREVSARWLAAKGKKELDFMVGELGRPDDSDRRIFVAVSPGGVLQGFITYVPVWGSRPGFLHDLTRRRPEAPVGCMELCNAHALEYFAAEGIEYLHFGFTPFVIEGEERPGANRFLAALLRLLWRHGSFLYPARSQAAYKLKWAPDLVEPEYVAARPFSLRAVLDLLLLTRSL
jgi:lysylphosphatidylglycerol synthetase-like protein (DUF2156 family)